MRLALIVLALALYSGQASAIDYMRAVPTAPAAAAPSAIIPQVQVPYGGGPPPQAEIPHQAHPHPHLEQPHIPSHHCQTRQYLENGYWVSRYECD